MEKELAETIARLSQLRHLRAEADLLNARVRELELAAQGGAQRITGMPRGTAAGDRVARFAVRLADLRGELARRRDLCLDELERLYALIGEIDDSLLRQIFVYRYVDGMSWQRVATAIGEGDEQYPRRLHNRYLRERLCREAATAKGA